MIMAVSILYGKSYFSHMAFKFIDDQYDAIESRGNQQGNNSIAPFFVPPQDHFMPPPTPEEIPQAEPFPIPESQPEIKSLPLPAPVPEDHTNATKELDPPRQTEAQNEVITMSFQIPQMMMNLANATMAFSPPMPPQ